MKIIILPSSGSKQMATKKITWPCPWGLNAVAGPRNEYEPFHTCRAFACWGGHDDDDDDDGAFQIPGPCQVP